LSVDAMVEGDRSDNILVGGRADRDCVVAP
jgi:hypothetical protein